MVVGSAVAQVVALAGGWALFAVGTVGASLPGHLGLPIMVAGGIVLARRSRSFRRMMAGIRARFPVGSERLTARCRRWPRALRYLILRTDPRRVLSVGRCSALYE